MRAEELRTIPADDVLAYVKSIHSGFQIPQSITTHPKWRKTRIPVNKLNLPSLDGEEHVEDPYNRVQMIDLDQVNNINRQFIERHPIVVDPNGFVIDGNHRATAAKLRGLFDIPAYIPVQ